RLLASCAFEQWVALELAYHAGSLVGAERRDAERHVPQDLDEHAAEADHHRRAEQRVLRDPENGLPSAGHRLAYEHAVDARSLPACAPCLAHELVVHAADLARRPDPDPYEAEVALVRQVGRSHLHHDRVT